MVLPKIPLNFIANDQAVFKVHKDLKIPEKTCMITTVTAIFKL